MSRQQHWESVYKSKGDDQVSWTQDEPRLSLALIREVCRTGRVIDVGGGASRLAERLSEAVYEAAVLDLSASALERARARVGAAGERVKWIVGDVCTIADAGCFELWHDRAVFHFLTEAADRAAYVRLLTRSLVNGGHAVIATFAPDGPEQCSGLPVGRYDAAALGRELGEGFELIKSVPETHHTPWGTSQSFQYSVLRKR